MQDSFDETALLSAMNESMSGSSHVPRADLNSDGVVDDLDQKLFNAAYEAKESGVGVLSGTDLSGFSYGDATYERKNLDNRIGFGGYMWDPWLGAYHVRHRVYDPNLRRWLQVDPIGYAGGDWDLSRYCNGDPVNFVDPMGLCSVGSFLDNFTPIGRGLNALSGGGAGVFQIHMQHQGNCDQIARFLGQKIKDGQMSGQQVHDILSAQGCLDGGGAAGQIISGAASGFGQGAHDGYITSANSAASAMTFGLIGKSLEQLAAEGALYDASNPMLVASQWSGTVAGGALMGAVGTALSGAAAAGSSAAWYGNALLSGTSVALGGYTAGNGITNVALGNYGQGASQILSGGLGMLGGFGGAMAGRGAVSLDNNAIVSAINGGPAAAAIAGRVPLISRQAAREFLAGGPSRGGTPEALRQFMRETGARIGRSASEVEVAALQREATTLGRVLHLEDARIVGSGIREGVPTLTNDRQMWRFLEQSGRPFERF